MKVTNETRNTSTQLEITHRPAEQEDQYHICVGLFSPGEEVELLDDIENWENAV